jgi:nifR3 family TIM-barrel protein
MRIGTVEIPQGALLAPMAGVTDLPFRRICAQMGAALTYTEMVSAKGLFYSPDRSQTLLGSEGIAGPRAVQLFGNEPQIMADMALLHAGEYDIIDVNMGCPVTKIVKAGQGSALMRQPDWAAQIVSTLVQATGKPVTVKFRKGWDDDHVNAVEFALCMQDAGAAAVTVHGRTREQFYSGVADWDILARVKAALHVPVIGNGDVFEAKDALALMKHTGCDAVMVGRGAQGNPWLFGQIQSLLAGEEPQPVTIRQRIAIARRHSVELCALKGESIAVQEMRKHISWYIKGIPQAARWRAHLNTLNRMEEIDVLLDRLEQETPGL